MHDTIYEPGIMGRRIGVQITPKSLAPRVFEALRALGYTMIDLDSDRTTEEARASCGIWIVDEERIAELPESASESNRRILLIASARSRSGLDSRVFASTRRPARLGAVYEMIQSALESTPRSAPRIKTQLSARCIRGDQRSIGAVLSLSEGGCLLRSGERLSRGAKLDLQFALPTYGLISTRAECRYAWDTNAGLAFSESSAEARHSIAHFVTTQLADGGAAVAMPQAGGGSIPA